MAFYHINLLGSLNSGTEQFVTGFWAQSAAGGTPSANSIAQAVAGQLKVASAMTQTQKLINSNDSYDSVSVYLYPTIATTHATDQGVATLGLTGTGSSLNPLQCAQVVSLRTGVPGRRYRGRMFLPNKAGILTNTGFLSSPTVAALATEWASILHNVNTGTTGLTVGVVSRAGNLFQPLTSVIVDARPDTQRRRANRQGTGTRGSATV